LKALTSIVSWQLGEVSSCVAAATNIADVDVIAEAVSKKGGLPIDVGITDVSSSGKVNSSSSAECESIVMDLRKKSFFSLSYYLWFFSPIIIISKPGCRKIWSCTIPKKLNITRTQNVLSLRRAQRVDREVGQKAKKIYLFYCLSFILLITLCLSLSHSMYFLSSQKVDQGRVRPYSDMFGPTGDNVNRSDSVNVDCSDVGQQGCVDVNLL